MLEITTDGYLGLITRKGQLRWGPEQPGLVGEIPARAGGLGLDLEGPFQLKSCWDSIIGMLLLLGVQLLSDTCHSQKLCSSY